MELVDKEQKIRRMNPRRRARVQRAIDRGTAPSSPSFHKDNPTGGGNLFLPNCVEDNSTCAGSLDDSDNASSDGTDSSPPSSRIVEDTGGDDIEEHQELRELLSVKYMFHERSWIDTVIDTPQSRPRSNSLP